MTPTTFTDRAKELRARMAAVGRPCESCGTFQPDKLCDTCLGKRLVAQYRAAQLRTRLKHKANYVPKPRPSTSRARMSPSLCKRIRGAGRKTRGRMIREFAAKRGLKAKAVYNWLNRHGGPLMFSK